MKIASTLAVVPLSAVLLAAQGPIPPALQEMVDTERAFAAAATVKGVRDSFLEFFAQDSIALTPAPVSARARLEARPSQPFSVQELRWEPRTGDVAASGEIGWLTGPSIFVNHAAADGKPQHGNYLSVWRQQADGAWRAFIDVGTSLPRQTTFAPGFTRHAFPQRYTGTDGKAAATAALLDADRTLNADLGSVGAPKAYVKRLTPASRLHREGFMPTLGTSAIANWLTVNATGLTAATSAGDASSAGDLGYTYGTYQVAGAKPESGAYVRIWTRNTTGLWLICADVTQPSLR